MTPALDKYCICLFINTVIGISDQGITSFLITVWNLFEYLNQSKKNEPSATYSCQLRISHVFDDVSWEGDKDGLEGMAPSILHTNAQN